MENLNYYYLVIMFLLPILFLIIIFKFFTFHPNKNLPPSPPSLPIIGHFHLIKTSFHLALASLASKYGPIIFLQLGCKSLVVISSPSAIEECFTKHDVVFANRPRSVSGDHLTYDYKTYVWSPHGHFWRILRKLSVVEMFSAQSLQKSAVIREENIHSLLRIMSKGSKTSSCRQRLDLNYLSSTFSFNNIMRIFTGKLCVQEEQVASEIGKQIVKQIRGTFFTSLSLGVCDYFPVLRWIGYKGIEKNLMLIHKKRDEYVENLIRETRERKNCVQESHDNSILIDTLFSLQESEPEFYTYEVIKSTVLVIFASKTQLSTLILLKSNTTSQHA